MYRTLTMMMADETTREIPFKSCATTGVRFKMIFKKELLGSITSIMYSAGPEGMQRIIEATQKAETEGKETISLDEMDPETLQAIIKIGSSGELDTISKMAYIMNMAATGEDMNALSFEKYMDWLDQFDSMEFLTKSMEIIDIYMTNRETSVEPKKDTAQLTGK